MTAKVTATPANVGNWQKSHKMVRKSNNLLRICILIFLYIARGPKSSLSVFPSVEGSKNETRDSLCWMRRRRFVHWWCYCVHSLSCCVLPLTCHEAAKTMIQPFPYSHTDAKSQFLSKSSILMKSTPLWIWIFTPKMGILRTWFYEQKSGFCHSVYTNQGGNSTCLIETPSKQKCLSSLIIH